MNTFDLTPDYHDSVLAQRHQILFNSVFCLPRGVAVAGRVRLNSGRPFNAMAGSERNNDGVNNDRPDGASCETASGPSKKLCNAKKSKPPACNCKLAFLPSWRFINFKETATEAVYC